MFELEQIGGYYVSCIVGQSRFLKACIYRDTESLSDLSDIDFLTALVYFTTVL